MTSRTRRLSTSSVETVAEESIRWRQESSVLRSVPKTISNDDWPIFQLHDAIVLNRDGTTLENALNIVPNGPFIVRGNLHYTSEQKKSSVLVRERSPIPIEIRQCLLYSVGETDDGSPQIWVSGRAGWFEISPCPAYQGTYDSMCQATTLYYSIMDIINDTPPKRGKKPKVPDHSELLGPLFHKYAAFVGDGSTLEDVEERCKHHAVFLISQFMQDDGAMDWQSTDFYKWMKSENKAVFQKVEAARKNPRQRTRSPSIVEPPPRAATSVSRKSASIEEIDEATFATRSSRRSNSSVAQQTTIAMHPRHAAQPPARAATPPAPVDVDTDLDSPFATVLAAVEACFDSLHASKNGVKISALLNKLYFGYRFPSYKDVTSGSHKRPIEEVLHYNAAALLAAIDAEKYQDGGEVYEWLQEHADKEFVPVAMKPGSLPLRLTPREQRPFHTRKSETKLDSPKTRQGSVRTPSPSTPRMGKRPGRPVGSKSSLRPIKSTKKRSRTFDEDDTQDESVSKKLQFPFDEDGDETMGEPGNQSAVAEELDTILHAGDSSDSSSAEEDDLDDENKPTRLSILAEKLPDPMPTGYQGTWVCDQQDCDFIARGGDDDELESRISAHLEEHEQLVDRMQLAVAESRGLLPINHLLDKLKQLGESLDGPTDSQGNVAPRPVKRNLFV